MKSVRMRSFSGPYIPAFGRSISPNSVQMRENTDQKNSKCGHFLRSVMPVERLFLYLHFFQVMNTKSIFDMVKFLKHWKF